VLLCDRRDQTPRDVERAIESLGFQYCYEGLAEYFSTTLLFWIKEARPFNDEGFQVRDLQSLAGVTLQTSPLQPFNENFYRFS